MEIKTYSKTGSFTESMIQAANEKFKKLEKFAKDNEPLKVTIETFKNNEVKLKAQLVLKNNKHIRTEVDGKDYYECLDLASDNLKVQATNTKEKFSRKERTRKQVIATPIEEADQPVIKKIKRFKLDAVTEGIAMMELEKLGHESYIFKNINEDDKVCMIYKRIDGDYSMIVIDN